MSTRLIAFRACSDEELEQQIAGMKEIAIEMNYAPEPIEIQIFEGKFPIEAKYIYRVLEDGYGLRNKMWKQPDFFKNVFIDTRASDEVEGGTPEEIDAVCEIIDKMIHEEQYRMATIMEAVKWPR